VRSFRPPSRLPRSRVTSSDLTASRHDGAGIFLLCIALTFVFAFAIEIEYVCVSSSASACTGRESGPDYRRTDAVVRSVLVIIFAVATYLSYACESPTSLALCEEAPDRGPSELARCLCSRGHAHSINAPARVLFIVHSVCTGAGAKTVAVVVAAAQGIGVFFLVGQLLGGPLRAVYGMQCMALASNSSWDQFGKMERGFAPIGRVELVASGSPPRPRDRLVSAPAHARTHARTHQ
jgi:hypothetical protein